MRLGRYFVVLICMLTLGTCIPRGYADTFHYDYSFVEPFFGTYSFTFDSTSLIASDEPSLTPSSCTALGSTCNQIGILPTLGEVKIYGVNGLVDTGLPPSFFQIGSHTFDSSSMTITNEVDASPVPEPSTLVLLTAGIFAGASRLRRFKTKP
jgi:hypothetical protein